MHSHNPCSYSHTATYEVHADSPCSAGGAATFQNGFHGSLSTLDTTDTMSATDTINTDPLPLGWVEALDPQSGKRYYYNTLTSKSSYERPGLAPSRRAASGKAASTAPSFDSPDKLANPDKNTSAKMHRTIAMQIMVCDHYTKGKALARDVLKVTTASLSKGGLKTAFQCVQRIKAAGVAPDVIVYTALISACVREGRADLALAVFDEMKAAGVVPNVYTYTALISGLEKAGRLDKALAVFDGMKAAGVAPNTATHNALLAVLGRSRRVDQALAIYKKMKTTGPAPDVITFNVMISALGEAGRTDEALLVFAEMEAAKIAADGLTYGTLIAVCQKAGRTERAAALLQSAISTGVFKKSLGYCQEQNALNFHANSIYEKYTLYEHEPGVPAGVAKALFQYHWEQGHIKPGTCFIVGCHGMDRLNQATRECLERHGMRAVTARYQDGKPNAGKLIAMLAGSASLPGPQSVLNPNATPFIPSWKQTLDLPLAKAGGPGLSAPNVPVHAELPWH